MAFYSRRILAFEFLPGSASERCMKILEKDYTITTIYFDGQFWCALIEKNVDGKNFAGRYVFGAEPSNPRLLNWMLNEFSKISLLPVNEKPKIRFKKLAKMQDSKFQSIPKSLKAFSKAQKEYAEEKKARNRKQRKILEKEKYLLKKSKKKQKT